MANNYDINYEDERFTQVKNAEQTALSDLEKTYGGMIEKADQYYEDQITASKEWADKQSQLQQEQTDFTIEQIEQQKAQAQKDYLKEQSGAYVDWRKQSNQYGTEAEKMASAGLDRTGFSESSQVSMYNAYQNRVAVARDAVSRAMLNYENGIKDARLQNNAALAEIHFKALQEQLRLSLEGFQYENQLILEQASKKTEIQNVYYNRWQDVLAQVNHENAFAEQIRQHNASLALQQAQFEEEKRQFNEQLALQKKKSVSSGGVLRDNSAGKINKTSTSSTNSAKLANAVNQATKNVPVNNDSVIALGFGPISSSRLASLEANGVIQSYVKNGQRYFKRTAVTSKLQELYG